MAGIGVKLNKIYSKKTVVSGMLGVGYSMGISITPMIVVVLAVFLMQHCLGYSKLDYSSRELLSCTIIYIFIFGLITASPFIAVISKYLSDIIYYERYNDILPCYYSGLALNVALGFLVSAPFCVREYLVGQVELFFVFAGFIGFMALVIVFYTMLYLSICKTYGKISIFFAIGMASAFLISLMMVYWFKVAVIYSMLISLDLGLLIIACLEYALLKNYFRVNSGNYKEVFIYIRKNMKMLLANFLYTLGMYIHNFVFWTSDSRMIVAKSFVCMTSYDMATCLATFTNISATVIFISQVEMNFHDKYKAYSEAVIGGRGMDIQIAKKRMFEQLSDEILNLVRIQFIITIVLFFIAMIVFPLIGFGGAVMEIYPCMCAGYYILFIMYAAIIFLYYFHDVNGALWVAFVFVAATLVGAVAAKELPASWYGIGFVFGAFAGWTVAYFRLRYIEKSLDIHIFCKGHLMKKKTGKMPDNLVYAKNEVKKSHK